LIFRFQILGQQHSSASLPSLFWPELATVSIRLLIGALEVKNICGKRSRSFKMSRKCVNDPDSFCYICGEFTAKHQRRELTPTVRESYRLYFGFRINDEDKSWVPHGCCVSCAAGLSQWKTGRRISMPFAVPVLWREPTNHFDDCYFCLTQISGVNARYKDKITYAKVPCVSPPVAHSESRPVPKPQPIVAVADDDPWLSTMEETTLTTAESTKMYECSSTDSRKYLSQSELNDLVREFSMSKDDAELLASRLMQWNFLNDGARVCAFRNRNERFKPFFSMKDDLCFCNDVAGLFYEIGHTHVVTNWRLFIDSSKSGLKAVLLHHGSTYPSVPVAYSCALKETYSTMQLLLRSIDYKIYRWHLCGDFKVISLLLGMQLGYVKYGCFLCKWDSRAKIDQYTVKSWEPRTEFVPGQANVIQTPLVDPKDVYLPPLHIKLGLAKNFIKKLDHDSKGFAFLRKKFKKLSEDKLREGVLVGPQIRDLMADDAFERSLKKVEKEAWLAFKEVCHGFLGNFRAENYRELVGNMISKYHVMGVHMSLKIHIMHSHLDFFPDNLGSVSDEQGERFHQDVAIMEQRYQGKWTPSMLSDYIWMLKRDLPDAEHSRKSSKKYF
jgi:hypothetical protein